MDARIAKIILAVIEEYGRDGGLGQAIRLGLLIHSMQSWRLLSLQLAKSYHYLMKCQDAIGCLTFDSATEYLFGRDICSLSVGLPYPQPLTGRPLRKVINEFVDPVIEDALEKPKISSNSKEGEFFLEQLITRFYKTSSSIFWWLDETRTLTFYILSQRPNILAPLRTEVFEQVGVHSLISESYSYSIRIYRDFASIPRSDFQSRHALARNREHWWSPDLCPEDYRMHRRTDLWGPDGKSSLPVQSSIHPLVAVELDPDRFIDHRAKFITSSPLLDRESALDTRSSALSDLMDDLSLPRIKPHSSLSDFFRALATRLVEAKLGRLPIKGTDKIRFALLLTMTVWLGAIADR
ncbi:hypothetical protein C8J56DRAFT_903373 [Mycena floridula]|nr:hypothetical protein C8J56DRAFT_903373 [Mycena floridula]